MLRDSMSKTRFAGGSPFKERARIPANIKVSSRGERLLQKHEDIMSGRDFSNQSGDPVNGAGNSARNENRAHLRAEARMAASMVPPTEQQRRDHCGYRGIRHQDKKGSCDVAQAKPSELFAERIHEQCEVDGRADCIGDGQASFAVLMDETDCENQVQSEAEHADSHWSLDIAERVKSAGENIVHRKHQ